MIIAGAVFFAHGNASAQSASSSAETTASSPGATSNAPAAATSTSAGATATSSALAIPDGTIEIVSQGMSVPQGGTVKGSAIVTVISSKPATAVGLRFISGSRIALSAAASQDGGSSTRFAFTLADDVLATGQYTIVAYFSDSMLAQVPFARSNLTIEPAPEALPATAASTTDEEISEGEVGGEAATSTASSTDMVIAEEDRLSILVNKYDSLAECTSYDDCRTLCHADENEALCTQFLRDISATGTVGALTERIGARSAIDSDSDGIPDYDERAIFDTNPEAADTDEDGAADGDELLAQTNPLVAASSSESIGASASSTASSSAVVKEEVVFEDPHSDGTEASDLMAVNAVSLVATSSPLGTTTEVVFTGEALPNSFVTLFVFSTPQVFTTKADQEGNWNVAIATLEDGSHEAYVAYTTASGTILAKSGKLDFQKSPEGITLGEKKALALPPPPAPKEEFVLQPWMKWAAMGAGALALLCVLYFFYRRKRQPAPFNKGDEDDPHYDADDHDDESHTYDHIDVHDPHVVVLPRRR
jgi:hypothetical protein